MKIEQKSLDGSASEIVSLQAKYAGAAVLHMLFLTSDISINVDLGLVNTGTSNLCF